MIITNINTAQLIMKSYFSLLISYYVMPNVFTELKCEKCEKYLLNLLCGWQFNWRTHIVTTEEHLNVAENSLQRIELHNSLSLNGLAVVESKIHFTFSIESEPRQNTHSRRDRTKNC